MKRTDIIFLIQTINSLFLLLLVVGCGSENERPTLSIKPSVYSMTQSQTLKVDRSRGTQSFVSQTGEYISWSGQQAFNTEAFDIYPKNSQLTYSHDGSFSFTPPRDFNGIARFKIR